MLTLPLAPLALMVPEFPRSKTCPEIPDIATDPPCTVEPALTYKVPVVMPTEVVPLTVSPAATVMMGVDPVMVKL